MKRGISFLLVSTLSLPVTAGEIVILQTRRPETAHTAERAARSGGNHPEAGDEEGLGDYLEPGRWSVQENSAAVAREARHYSAGEPPPLQGGVVVVETPGLEETLIVAPPAMSNEQYLRGRARAYMQAGQAGHCNDADSVVGAVEGRARGQVVINTSQKGGATSGSRPCQ